MEFQGGLKFTRKRKLDNLLQQQKKHKIQGKTILTQQSQGSFNRHKVPAIENFSFVLIQHPTNKQKAASEIFNQISDQLWKFIIQQFSDHSDFVQIALQFLQISKQKVSNSLEKFNQQKEKSAASGDRRRKQQKRKLLLSNQNCEGINQCLRINFQNSYFRLQHQQTLQSLSYLNRACQNTDFLVPLKPITSLYSLQIPRQTEYFKYLDNLRALSSTYLKKLQIYVEAVCKILVNKRKFRRKNAFQQEAHISPLYLISCKKLVTKQYLNNSRFQMKVILVLLVGLLGRLSEGAQYYIDREGRIKELQKVTGRIVDQRAFRTVWSFLELSDDKSGQDEGLNDKGAIVYLFLLNLVSCLMCCGFIQFVVYVSKLSNSKLAYLRRN